MLLFAASIAGAEDARACVVGSQEAKCNPALTSFRQTGGRTLTVALSQRISLVGHGISVSTNNPRDANEQYIRDLYLDFAPDEARVRVGKLEPETGFRWHAAPAAYGGSLAKAGYTPGERLGIAAQRSYNAGLLGRHRLSGTAFTADRSPLSRSWMERMQRVAAGLETGGEDDRRHPVSGALAVDGSAVPGMSGLRYHLALLRLGPERNDQDAALGIDAAMAYQFSFWGLTLSPVIEYTRFSNLGRVAGREGSFTTGGFELKWHSWRLTAGYTAGRIAEPNGDLRPSDDLSVDSTIHLTDGLHLSGSWTRHLENGIATNSGRVDLTYNLRF